MPRAGLGKPWSVSNATNLLHHGSQNRIQKLVETWRPERDLDCTSHAEQEQHEPMHGLKLVVEEEALPLREQPEFLAPAELAKRGLLAPDTWNCKPALINLKVSIDGFLEQSDILVGWPLHIQGAVRQSCAHRDITLQELDDLLSEYDLKRDLVEINRKAPPMVPQRSVE